jgi:hypothetical protein
MHFFNGANIELFTKLGLQLELQQTILNLELYNFP